MTERDDQSIDHELSGIAMAATHEHEQTVSGNEAEAALNAVRSRIAAGDLGGAPPSIPLASAAAHRRSAWVRFGAVAAAVAMVALGLVAVVGGDRSNDVISPATVPDPSGPVTAPPSITPTAPDVEAESTTTAESESSVPETVEPSETGFVEQTIAVDAANPPPLIEPTVWQSVPIDSANVEGVASVGIDDASVLVKQKGVLSITVLDRSGDEPRVVDLKEDLSSITAGPFDTVYGLGDLVFAADNDVEPQGFRFVGISLSEDGPAPTGDVFGAVETALYTEPPPYLFGTGDSGVIDRFGVPGDTIIDFSEGRDGQVGSLGVPVPRFADTTRWFVDPAAGRIEIAERGWAWNIDIARDPTNSISFVGSSPPAPTTGDRVIYFDRIGAALSDDDFARSSLPVIAILEPDGSGSWVRLPDDWDVVASDVWGTVLMRRTATELEFALLDDALEAARPDASTPPDPELSGTGENEDEPTLTPTEAAPANGLTQPTALQRNCAGISIACTQLALTETGRIVGFDEVDDTFRVYDAEGTELQTEVELAETVAGLNPFFVAVGPDDVAYLEVDDAVVTDPVGRVLAIPLVGSNAGSVVMEWTGRGRSGDSSLIARKSGLTVVPCCGGDGTRPTPDATIYRWVDRGGGTIESTAPSFDLNLGRDANSLTRIDTADDGSPIFTPLPLPTAYANPRDFPQVVATDDGGALAYDFVQTRSGGVEVFVDFGTDWPRTNVENGSVYYRQIGDSVGVGLLEPSGTVIVAEGQNIGQWVRRNLDEIAIQGWPDRTEGEVGSDAVTAPGLNDLIDDDQPVWAADPELFAWQFATSLRDVGANVVEYDDSDSPVITITSTGLLGDSVTATRLVVTTSRGDDGLLRFVSAVSSFQCEPGRGHQDFSTELCT